MNSPNLWKTAIGLAKRMVRSRILLCESLKRYEDDLNQASLIGAWKASQTYDSSKNTKFTTYAWHVIRGEINLEKWRCGFFGFQAEKRQSYGKCKLPEVSRMKFDTVVVDESTNKVDNSDLFDYAIRQMRPEKLQQVARLYWLEELPSKSIAKQVGVSLSRVEQMHRMAYKKMAEVIERITEV